MKLNIGSGEIRSQFLEKDWVNIDIYKGYTKAINKNHLVIANGCYLPFRDNFFDEVRCIHTLEHIERKNHRLLYQEVYRVLKSNCYAYFEVPNFIDICNAITKTYNEEELRCLTLSIYGKGRYEGDEHRWGFSKQLLQQDLLSQKFLVRLVEPLSNHYKNEPVICMKAKKCGE